MSEAQDRLVDLAGKIHVGAYHRRNKAGKDISVDSYFRSPGKMALWEIADELKSLSSNTSIPPAQKANRIQQLTTETRKRIAGVRSESAGLKSGAPRRADPLDMPADAVGLKPLSDADIHKGVQSEVYGKLFPSMKDRIGKLDSKAPKSGPSTKAEQEFFDKIKAQGKEQAKGMRAKAEAKPGGKPEPKSTSAIDALKAHVAGLPQGKSAGMDELAKAHKTAGKGTGTSKGTVDDPINVGGNVELAAKLLADGKHIRLNKVDEVGTLLDKLKAMVDEANAKGDKAPTFDLCKVSVPKTNLFCAQSKGIPRAKMPQFGGQPRAGSAAEKLPRDKKGEVSTEAAFQAKLKELGIKVTLKDVKADHLKASQMELDGPKVAGMSKAMAAGKVPDAPIFVTKDGYIIDGHHRWASKVALDAQDGHMGDISMPVNEVDMEIGEALDFANAFTNEIGILPKGLGAAAEGVKPDAGLKSGAHQGPNGPASGKGGSHKKPGIFDEHQLPPAAEAKFKRDAAFGDEVARLRRRMSPGLRSGAHLNSEVPKAERLLDQTLPGRNAKPADGGKHKKSGGFFSSRSGFNKDAYKRGVDGNRPTDQRMYSPPKGYKAPPGALPPNTPEQRAKNAADQARVMAQAAERAKARNSPSPNGRGLRSEASPPEAPPKTIYDMLPPEGKSAKGIRGFFGGLESKVPMRPGEGEAAIAKMKTHGLKSLTDREVASALLAHSTPEMRGEQFRRQTQAHMPKLLEEVQRRGSQSRVDSLKKQVAGLPKKGLSSAASTGPGKYAPKLIDGKWHVVDKSTGKSVRTVGELSAPGAPTGEAAAKALAAKMDASDANRAHARQFYASKSQGLKSGAPQSKDTGGSGQEGHAVAVERLKRVSRLKAQSKVSEKAMKKRLA